MKKIEELENFCSLGSIDAKKIIEAEKKLGIKFAKEYKKIISKYGIISCNGHELTGICNSKRLNVVDVTLKERENSTNTNNLYVIEEANIDDIVIWQDSDGIVYITKNRSNPQKISNSIVEYINN